jgi:hypothetical protein
MKSILIVASSPPEAMSRLFYAAIMNPAEQVAWVVETEKGVALSVELRYRFFNPMPNA